MFNTENLENPITARISGVILITTSLLMVFAMLHHPIPHAHSFEELVTEVERIQTVNQLVHGAAISFVLLMVLGMASYCSRLGFHRITIRAGMISFCSGAFALIVAAMVSGFIVPSFLQGYDAATPADADVGRRILSALRSINASFDMLGVSTISVALVFFGIAALVPQPIHPQPIPASRLWIIGVLGIVAGTTGCIGLFTGHTQATVHGVIAFATLLAAWLVAVGVYLARTPASSKSAGD